MKIQLDTLLRYIIYLQVFVSFSYQQDGLGIINIGIPLIIILGIERAFKKNVSINVFGEKKSWIAIYLFFIIAVLSGLITIFTNPNAVLSRYIGVLLSLLFLFLTYYLTSLINHNYNKSFVFISDFLNVCLLHSAFVILEFIIVSISGQNYISLIVGYTLSFFRLPTAVSWGDDSIVGRYKGILFEPGEVISFAIPAFTAFLALLFFDKNTKKTYCISKLIVLSMSVLLTGSSTGIFLMLAILLFFLIVSNIKLRNVGIMQIMLYIFVGGVAALLCAYLLFQYQDFLPLPIQERVISIGHYLESGVYDSETNISVMVYLNSLNSVLFTLKNNPIIGFGPGYFSIAHTSVIETINLKNFQGLEYLNQHDGYSMLLRLIVEFGIVGTITFLSIFYLRLSQAFKLFIFFQNQQYNKYSAMNNKAYKALLLTTSAASASLLHCLINKPSYWNMLLPILFGLCFKRGFTQELDFLTAKDRNSMFNSN